MVVIGTLGVASTEDTACKAFVGAGNSCQAAAFPFHNYGAAFVQVVMVETWESGQIPDGEMGSDKDMVGREGDEGLAEDYLRWVQKVDLKADWGWICGGT